jgi:hypothetical protein
VELEHAAALLDGPLEKPPFLRGELGVRRSRLSKLLGLPERCLRVIERVVVNASLKQEGQENGDGDDPGSA